MTTSGQLATVADLLRRRAALEAEVGADEPLDVGPGLPACLPAGMAGEAGATCMRRLMRVEVVGGRLARHYELTAAGAKRSGTIRVQVNRAAENDDAYLASVAADFLNPVAEPLPPDPRKPPPEPEPIEADRGVS